MEYNLFSDLVKRHFSFLVNKFNFSIIHEEYYPDAMGNAIVVFTSSQTGIRIVLDRSQVLINIGPLSKPHQDWFEFSDIIRFFVPDLDPVYVFPEDFSNYQSALENQVSRLAQIMYKYCKPILRGNFSMQDKIKELEKKRVEEMMNHFQRSSRG